MFTLTELSLHQRILALLRKTPGMTMEQILENAWRGYRFEWRESVTELAEQGKIIRSWDNEGMPHYHIA